MKFQKAVLFLVLGVFSLSACKTETKKDIVSIEKVVAENLETISLDISGMTCEIGCAKLIQSKLSKKEGITMAKVVFKDSIANVNFDANKISTKEIIGLIDGIADGQLYKATEISVKK
ncbi:MAG: heavy-metal-associated domain-containing protein [Flavobacteriaceae bacterium]